MAEKKAKWSVKKKALVFTAAFLAVMLAALTGLYFVFDKKRIGVGYSEPRYMSPVAAFGLSLSQPGELVSEKAVFQEIKGRDYSVRVEYTVKTDGPAQLYLPYGAESRYDVKPVTAVVDGKKTALKKNGLLATYVSHEILNKGNEYAQGGSVFFLPDYISGTTEEQIQSRYTYQALYEFIRPSAYLEKTAREIPFYVYDVSGADSFTVEGRMITRRFLLEDKAADNTQFGIELLDKQQTQARYTYSTAGNKSLMLIPKVEGTMEVAASGQEITPQERTLGEILDEMKSFDEQEKVIALTSIYAYLSSNEHRDLLIPIAPDAAGMWGKMPVMMYTAELPSAGEHTITVEYTASGGSYEEQKLLMWIGSPESLWSKTGKREVEVVTGKNRYTYEAGGEPMNIRLLQGNE